PPPTRAPPTRARRATGSASPRAYQFSRRLPAGAQPSPCGSPNAQLSSCASGRAGSTARVAAAALPDRPAAGSGAVDGRPVDARWFPAAAGALAPGDGLAAGDVLGVRAAGVVAGASAVRAPVDAVGDGADGAAESSAGSLVLAAAVDA